jgi:hypothetical protein
MLAGQPPHFLDGAVDELLRRAPLDAKLHFAGLDFFQVQDVVDEPNESIGVVDGDPEQLFAFGGKIARHPARQKAERTPKRSQRRAELVGNHRDELVFHPLDFSAFGDVADE